MPREIASEGEARVPVACEIEEGEDLVRVRHARHREADGEEEARHERDGVHLGFRAARGGLNR